MNETRFTLRIPTELHNAIVNLAKNNHRSMNGQIVFWLERMVKDAGSISDRDIQTPQPKPVAAEAIGQDD